MLNLKKIFLIDDGTCPVGQFKSRFDKIHLGPDHFIINKKGLKMPEKLEIIITYALSFFVVSVSFIPKDLSVHCR